MCALNAYDTWCSRMTGLASPTGSVSRCGVTWLPSDVGSANSSSTTLIGTIALIRVDAVTDSARVSSQPRSAPAMVARMTSLTLPPCSLRTLR